MSADNPPLSSVSAEGRPRGFDLRLAEALAVSLGRRLKVVPFESSFEKESTLAQEVNALLSSGVCDLASGFPLMAEDIGLPSRLTARTPDYPGAVRKRERPFVTLGPLVASRAYYRAALGLVARPDIAGISSVAQVREAGWRVGAASGSLSGSWLMSVRNGALRSQVLSLSQREDPFAALTDGRAQAVMVPLSLWDNWRAGHVDTPYRVALRKSLPLHLGFVARDGHADLIERLNTVIEAARQRGDLMSWATSEGLTWVAPGEPEVLRGFSLTELSEE